MIGLARRLAGRVLDVVAPQYEVVVFPLDGPPRADGPYTRRDAQRREKAEAAVIYHDTKDAGGPLARVADVLAWSSVGTRQVPRQW